MSYKLTKHERETIIIFNEAEQEATVTTYNGTLIKKLDSLCSIRPEEAQLTDTDSVGGKTYTIPKKWVKVNATRILDDDVRQKLSDSMRATRAEQLKSNL